MRFQVYRNFCNRLYPKCSVPYTQFQNIEQKGWEDYTPSH